MAPEPWLNDTYDATQMRAAERWAIGAQGIPALTLMETAGAALAHHAGAVAKPGPVRVVCGKGNNGGDGLVAARHLQAAGYDVEVLLLWPEDQLSRDSGANLRRYEGPRRRLEGERVISAVSDSGLIIDAIFGTGFSGTPRAPIDAAIEGINAAAAPVVACDIPSGVDSSTGAIERIAVEADLTVTFHVAKIGQRVAPGKWNCGRLEVVDIGIPAEVEVAETAGTIDPKVLALVPRRGPRSSKFSSGRVVVVGGSRGLTGAVCLASEAALRAGAGYVQAVVPQGLEVIFEAKLTEVMTIGVAGRDGSLEPRATEATLAACAGADAVVIGPGLGRARWSAEFVAGLVESIEAPLVCDADALRALESDLSPIRTRAAPTILTPHAGEMAGLLARDRGEIDAHRLASARELHELSLAIVLLKGDDTIVFDGERVAIGDRACPALATAGTGDVLAGTIAALIARGLDPYAAACAGVIGNVRAGLEAASRVGSADHVIARDVIDALPVGLVE